MHRNTQTHTRRTSFHNTARNTGSHTNRRKSQKSSPANTGLVSIIRKYSSSSLLQIGSVVVILIVGLLFGQGLLSANTVSSSAQQSEEPVKAHIITNFYTKSKSAPNPYGIAELPQP
jgi:hypothetical protein